MNTLTVNLHLMLVSFFRPTPQRYKILIERDAFPSDRYAVESQLRLHGLDPRDALLEIGREPDSESHGGGPGSWELDRARLDAVLAARGRAHRARAAARRAVPDAASGSTSAALAAAARRYGCARAASTSRTPSATCRSRCTRDAPDFAVWCSYKYLNAGPGAVGGCFVHRDAAARADLPRFAGWWGHDAKRRFLMEREFAPLRGAEGWQLSNPPILSLAPLAASLALFERSRARAPAAQVRAADALSRVRCSTRELGERVRILTPLAPSGAAASSRCSSIRAPAARGAVCGALRAAGVVADWREPNVLRLAPVPLYNRYPRRRTTRVAGC